MLNKREFVETVLEVIYEPDDAPIEVSAQTACEIGEAIYDKMIENGLIKEE